MESKYKYFSVTNQQLQLLQASLMRGLARFAELGHAVDEVQRMEAMELETVRTMLDKIGNTDRPIIRLLLTEPQFHVVRHAVKTMQLGLEDRPSLSQEYDMLIAAIEAGHISRREPARQGDAATAAA